MAKRLLAPVVASAIIGATGLSLVQAYEGLRLNTYIDPVGIPTVCYGHTGPDVKLGQRYTKAQCEQILLSDIQKHRAGVEKCVTKPLTPNQRDAVVSFAFNVGVSRFCGSTMAKKLNRGDYIGAADEFPKWKYAKVNGRNVVLPGLARRREAERRLFLTKRADNSPTASIAALRGTTATP